MKAFSRASASQAIAALGLRGINTEVARHWLRVWSDGRPPRTTRFFESCDARQVPAMAIFEVSHDQSLRCILAGSYYGLALGFELAGQDILALTPAADRSTRLQRAWSIGDGALLTGTRSFIVSSRDSVEEQEVYLPFSDGRTQNTRTYLMHTNWRPAGEAWLQGNVGTNLELVRDLHATSLV